MSPVPKLYSMANTKKYGKYKKGCQVKGCQVKGLTQDVFYYTIFNNRTRHATARSEPGRGFFLGDVYGKAIFNYSTTNSAVKK